MTFLRLVLWHLILRSGLSRRSSLIFPRRLHQHCAFLYLIFSLILRSGPDKFSSLLVIKLGHTQSLSAPLGSHPVMIMASHILTMVMLTRSRDLSAPNRLFTYRVGHCIKPIAFTCIGTRLRFFIEPELPAGTVTLSLFPTLRLLRVILISLCSNFALALCPQALPKSKRAT